MKASRKYWSLPALICLGFCGNVHGQTQHHRIEEPRWLTLNIREMSTGVFAEGTYEETSFGDGHAITHSHLFVGPSMGLNMDGSIYHPNLIRYRIETEGAYGWGHDTVDNRGSSFSRDLSEYLGRFN